MKALLVLTGLLLCFTMICCGIFAFLMPLSQSSNESTIATSTTKQSPSTPAGDASSDTTITVEEVDVVFAERTREYDSLLAKWDLSMSDYVDASSELAMLESDLAIHDANKPAPPTYELRKWSTWDKKFTTMAILISTDNIKAKLRKSDGNEIEVPKETLIAEDRFYLETSFDESNKYKDTLANWTLRRAELTKAISSATERVEIKVGPAPVAPDRAEIEAELVAAKVARAKAAQLAKEVAEADAKLAKLKRVKDELERLANVIRKADPEGSLIERIRADEDELIVTVSSAWHYQPYQMRLQLAQSLWNGWATVHYPSKPDRAFISLVDLNGNEVGGSRVGAGSLIWVQER